MPLPAFALRSACVRSATAFVLAASTPHVAAAADPTKPVRLVVPFPPGGAVDVIGRGLARWSDVVKRAKIVIE